MRYIYLIVLLILSNLSYSQCVDFIEVTVDGKKCIISTSEIQKVQDKPSGAYIYAPTKPSPLSCVTEESFSDIVDMLFSCDGCPGFVNVTVDGESCLINATEIDKIKPTRGGGAYIYAPTSPNAISCVIEESYSDLISQILSCTNGGAFACDDCDATNEIQQLSQIGDTIFLSEGGSIVIAHPDDVLTDIAIDGDTISYTDEDGNVTDLVLTHPDEVLTAISIDGDTISYTDEDGNVTGLVLDHPDDILTAISIDGDTISYTDEDGNVTGLVLDHPDEVLTAINTIGDTILRYVDENGTGTDINLCDAIRACGTDVTARIIQVSGLDITQILVDGAVIASFADTDDQQITSDTDSIYLTDGGAIAWPVDTFYISNIDTIENGYIHYTIDQDGNEISRDTIEIKCLPIAQDNIQSIEITDTITFDVCSNDDGMDSEIQEIVFKGSATNGGVFVNNGDCTVTFYGTSDGPSVQPYCVVTVDGDTSNTALITVDVEVESDMAVTKSVIDPSYGVGDTVQFLLTAMNLGPSDEPMAFVKDDLGSSLNFLGSTCGYDTSAGLWTVGNLPAGVMQLCTVDVVTSNVDIYNVAIIDGQNTDYNAINNISIYNYTAPPPPTSKGFTNDPNILGVTDVTITNEKSDGVDILCGECARQNIYVRFELETILWATIEGITGSPASSYIETLYEENVSVLDHIPSSDVIFGCGTSTYNFDTESFVQIIADTLNISTPFVIGIETFVGGNYCNSNDPECVEESVNPDNYMEICQDIVLRTESLIGIDSVDFVTVASSGAKQGEIELGETAYRGVSIKYDNGVGVYAYTDVKCGFVAEDEPNNLPNGFWVQGTDVALSPGTSTGCNSSSQLTNLTFEFDKTYECIALKIFDLDRIASESITNITPPAADWEDISNGIYLNIVRDMIFGNITDVTVLPSAPLFTNANAWLYFNNVSQVSFDYNVRIGGRAVFGEVKLCGCEQ